MSGAVLGTEDAAEEKNKNSSNNNNVVMSMDFGVKCIWQLSGASGQLGYMSLVSKASSCKAFFTW